MWEMVRERRRAERALPPLTGSKPRDQCPLSLAQQRLWRLEHSSQWQDAAYNVALAYRIEGPLELDAMREAYQAVVTRSGALRTVFVEPGPHQRVESELAAQFQVVEDQEPLTWANAEASHQFDITVGPPARLSLLRLSADDHICCFTAHHIVCDGWSAGVVLRDISSCYDDRVNGRPLPSAQADIGFVDFVEWQRTWLSTEAAAPYFAFWDGFANEISDLTNAAKTTSPSSTAGERIFFDISPSTSRLARLAADETSTTPFVTFLAAVVALGATTDTISAGESSPIAIAAANRGIPELAHVVGNVVNVLPFFLEPEPSWSFRELVNRVDQAAARLFVFQALPFEAALLRHARASVDSLCELPIPLFFDAPAPTVRVPLEIAGAVVTPFEISVKDAGYPLALRVFDDGSTYRGELTFAVDRYRDRAADIAAEYSKLLDYVLAKPDASLRDLQYAR